MKHIVKAIAISALTLSFNTLAQSATEALSMTIVKENLSKQQIQQTLDAWKADALTHIEARARFISDRAPIEARRDMVKRQIEDEYNQAAKQLGL
ncbi:hypothetical protein GI293_000075 [Vibrio fluvialis]|nr:hypothetical protein [Vibrio fluvialis]